MAFFLFFFSFFFCHLYHLPRIYSLFVVRHFLFFSALGRVVELEVAEVVEVVAMVEVAVVVEVVVVVKGVVGVEVAPMPSSDGSALWDKTRSF